MVGGLYVVDVCPFSVDLMGAYMDLREAVEIPALPPGSDLEIPNSTALKIGKNAVTTINRCPTDDAQRLCLYDLIPKFNYNNEFDIGGTYGDSLEFWFIFKTNSAFGKNNLLSLFVIAKEVGKFSIGISEDNKVYEIQTTMTNNERKAVTSLSDKLTWYSFNNTGVDNLHYIKTYCFTNKDTISLLKNQSSLYIPITIKKNVNSTIENVIKSIKIKHNVGEHLYTSEDKDFTLEANTGEKIKVHKIVLAAVSPVFKNKLKDKDYVTEKIPDFNFKEMEMFVEFLYKATIKDLFYVNYKILMDVAHKYHLKSLMVFVELYASKQLNVENVVDVAVVAEKYDLPNLLRDAFEFITFNKDVLISNGWRELNNANLIKKLFEFSRK